MSSSSKPPGGFPDTPVLEKKLTFEEALKTPPKGSPETSPTYSRTQSPEPKMTSRERSTPKIEPKLARQHNYAKWILFLKQTLGLYDHDDDSIWQIVTGDVTEPGKGTTTIGGSTSRKADANKLRQWQRDNDFAILTMKRNGEPEVHHEKIYFASQGLDAWDATYAFCHLGTPQFDPLSPRIVAFFLAPPDVSSLTPVSGRPPSDLVLPQPILPHVSPTDTCCLCFLL